MLKISQKITKTMIVEADTELGNLNDGRQGKQRATVNKIPRKNRAILSLLWPYHEASFLEDTVSFFLHLALCIL